MEKPNIILIMTDQQRHNSLGVYGNNLVITPNLDGLAHDGVVFSNAYSPCPACVPARGCCLTGLNQWNLGSLTYGTKLKEDYPVTLPKLLKNEGYHTIAIGKNHFTPQRAMHGYDRIKIDESSRIESDGFISDYMRWFEQETGHKNIIGENMDFNGYNGDCYPYAEYLHPTNWVKSESLSFIENADDKKPFFLKISFARPHSPYDAPKRLFDFYMNKDIPMPITCSWDKKFEKIKGGKIRWQGKATDAENKKARAGYLGNVTLIDEAIGQILDLIKAKKMYENTMIIFTSDHGDMLGDHNLWRKTYAYEGSVHIPMIIKDCNNKSENIVNTVPATLYDLMKTIMARVNKDCIFKTDGIDLLHEKRDFLHGEYIFGYDSRMDMQYIVDGKYKFIWYIRTGKFELFDLENDKSECENLSEKKQYKTIVDHFVVIISNIMKDRGIDALKRGKLRRYSHNLPYTEYGKLK